MGKSQHYKGIQESYPELMEAFEALGSEAKQAGPLGSKEAHLIQLAAAVTIRSEGATHSHTRRALEAGASPDEIRHAVLLLVSTIGFPTAVAGLSWVADILDAN
ncbi:carboxymuconolactone decarboxylase family protein [Dongshaea marina]|uniref:carboxymuconolactone decarboxylase family protein n=1 Tax=Dongshaea marina TaxID=2047966 RepID=UPI001900D444|nr:carboxymuconolactone decarboxylase family protein [Dongshaea marina]